MAEVQVQSLTIRHEAILAYLIANPTAKLGDVAVHFNLSQAWLSTIIHSDAFQAKLAERTDEVFNATVVPLREKLLGVGHQVVDKLAEVMENASPVTDKKFIADTADQVLKNLGFSPKSGPVIQNNVQNNHFATKSDLEEARAKMRDKHTPLTLEGTVVESSEGSSTERV